MSKISHTIRLKQRLKRQLALKQRLKRQLALARRAEARTQMTLMTVLAQLGGSVTLTRDAMFFVERQPGLAWKVTPESIGQTVVLQLVGVGGVSVKPQVAAPAPPMDENAMKAEAEAVFRQASPGPAIPMPTRTPLPIGSKPKSRFFPLQWFGGHGRVSR